MEKGEYWQGRRGILESLVRVVTGLAVMHATRNETHASEPLFCNVGFSAEERSWFILPEGVIYRRRAGTTAIRMDFCAGNWVCHSAGCITAGEPVQYDVFQRKNLHWYRSAEWVGATRLNRFSHLVERELRHALEAVK